MPSSSKIKLRIFELILNVCFGTLMTVLDTAFDFLPNIHPVACLIVAFTFLFGRFAVISIFVYVGLTLLLHGFAFWAIPYIYVWLPLWGMALLAVKGLKLFPEKHQNKYILTVCPLLCGLHGLLFGLLYAPAQAIMFGLSFKATLAWIIAGLPFDLIHALANTAMGMLCFPIISALKLALKEIKSAF